MEGRPFTPPAPSALQVTLPSKQPAAAGGMARPPSANRLAGGAAAASGDDWGDWGGSGSNGSGGAAAASNGSFGSNSEYTRAQYMASAANKEDFFARKMQVRGRLGVLQQVEDDFVDRKQATHCPHVCCCIIVDGCIDVSTRRLGAHWLQGVLALSLTGSSPGVQRCNTAA